MNGCTMLRCAQVPCCSLQPFQRVTNPGRILILVSSVGTTGADLSRAVTQALHHVRGILRAPQGVLSTALKI